MMRRVFRYVSLRNAACAIALWVAPLFIVSPEAYAEETRGGWYVSGSGGVEFVADAIFKSTSGVDVRKGEVSFKPGPRLSGALGYGWNNFRVEGEISWRRFKTDSLRYNHFTVQGNPLPGPVIDAINPTVRVDGTGSMWVLMANAWYDFDTGTNWTPYIGGGLGMLNVDFEVEVALTIPSLPPLTSQPISRVTGGKDDDWVFAWQVGAGIGYRLSDTVVIQLGYRFLDSSTIQFEWANGTKIDDPHAHDHGVEVGIRYRF